MLPLAAWGLGRTDVGLDQALTKEIIGCAQKHGVGMEAVG